MSNRYMIVTRKSAHNLDLREELAKAGKVAEFAIKNPDKLSTRFVSHIGLSSYFSDMILRTYGLHPPKTFRPEKTKLLIAGSKVRADIHHGTVYIPSLRATIRCEFPQGFLKVRRVMLDAVFAYINLEVAAKEKLEVVGWIGTDLNTVGPFVVAWIPTTGEVLRLGVEYHDLAGKYNKLEDSLRAKRKYKMLRRVALRREHRIDDLLHKTSKRLVEIAYENQCGIKVEDLHGIRQKNLMKRGHRRLVRQWPYYKFRTYVIYKAQIAGVPVQLVPAANTSRVCAQHNVLGARRDRELICPYGHSIDVDENAARLIARSNPKYEF